MNGKEKCIVVPKNTAKDHKGNPITVDINFCSRMRRGQPLGTAVKLIFKSKFMPSFEDIKKAFTLYLGPKNKGRWREYLKRGWEYYHQWINHYDNYTDGGKAQNSRTELILALANYKIPYLRSEQELIDESETAEGVLWWEKTDADNIDLYANAYGLKTNSIFIEIVKKHLHENPERLEMYRNEGGRFFL